MKTTNTHTHTSGPWHYAPGELIYGPDGESVASCRFVTNFKETNVANMRLVAAAPDLLCMLERVLDGVLRLPEIPRTLCSLDIEQVREVIAKAKGGA